MLFQVLASAISAHVRMVRRIMQDFAVVPKDFWCFDETRIYATKQDLNSVTLEMTSVRDPLVRKIANPREAYTGIVMVSGRGHKKGPAHQNFLHIHRAFPFINFET